MRIRRCLGSVLSLLPRGRWGGVDLGISVEGAVVRGDEILDAVRQRVGRAILLLRREGEEIQAEALGNGERKRVQVAPLDALAAGMRVQPLLEGTVAATSVCEEKLTHLGNE